MDSIKGRGASYNPQVRFDRWQHQAFDDGWEHSEDEAPPPVTEVTPILAKNILSHNDSPDIPFRQSINPYQGCEHGCIYCYARPSHAYLGLSPGLDFETKLFAKTNAADLLRAELAKPSYRCQVIALGANTDPYQPIEREWQITRRVIEELRATNHPFALITKSALVERDLDLLIPMAQKNLLQVAISLGTLDRDLARKLEPRAAAPQRRLQTIVTLAQAGIPVTVLVAPLIPALNDKDIESILERVADAGATSAHYVMLRLPYELKKLFHDWLERHYPLRKQHVISIIRQTRSERDNDPRFGTRMTGEGVFAELIRERFAKACHRLGLNKRNYQLDTTQFVPPKTSPQLELF